MRAAGRIEDQVAGTKALFDRLAVLFPAHDDSAVEHEIDVLDLAAVGLDAGTFRQLDHLHAVMLQRRGLLADIGHRSEERRGGKEGVSTGRSRWSPMH